MPEVSGLLKTALFVENLPRAHTFYEDLLGLRRFTAGERGCEFIVADREILPLNSQSPASGKPI